MIQLLLPQLAQLPSEQQSIKGLAKACGETVWTMRRAFGHVEAIYRVAVIWLGSRLAKAGESAPKARNSVLATLEAYGHFFRSVVETDDYRMLIQIIVRNAHRYDWVDEEYERLVVKPLCRLLTAAVEDAGQQLGGAVVLGDAAARLMLRRVVQTFTLPSVLPGGDSAFPGELEMALREIGRKAFESTVFVPWGSRCSAPGRAHVPVAAFSQNPQGNAFRKQEPAFIKASRSA
jgi:hypothetical protein